MKKHVSRTALRAALLGSVASLMSGAMAQSSDTAMETVVVTGIRGSLQRSLDVKREALGLVDAVSMEDIGKFPDSNLASALMRIPGVTVTRAASAAVTTTGQPTQITVRGFGPAFNETLFEGRKIPSGVGGRAFDFSGLSADMVQELQVFKTPDPSVSAGAIGATINVKYPKPFDKPGFNMAASVSSSYAPDDGRMTPNGNFLVSDTFAGGKLGVLLAGAYSMLRTTQNQVSNWGWEGSYVAACQYTSTCTTDELANTDTTKPIWFTQDLAYDYQQIAEQRKNARVALQYQPSDDLLITVDANYARDDLQQWQWAFAIWNNVSEMRNITTSSNGTIIDFTRNAPTDFDANYNIAVQQTYDYGINAKWNVNNNLTVTFDADQAMSALNPGGQANASADLGYGASTTNGTNSTNFRIVMPGGHSLPYYLNYGPNGDSSLFLDTSLIGSHVMTSTSQQNRNLVNQFKLESAWQQNGLTVKAGGQVVLDHYKMNAYNNFTNNQWQVYAGYGPDSNNYYSSSGLAAGVEIPASYFSGVIKTSSISGWNTVSALPGLLKFSQADIWSYLESLGDPTTKTIDGYNYSGVSGYTGKITREQDPNGYQRVYEDTYAGYFSVSNESQLAGMPLRISAGVRYEYTKLESSGLGRALTSMTILESDHTAYSFGYADQTQLKESNSYQYLLPNLDIDLSVSDDLKLRFDASRTLTRPNLSSMNPNTSYGGRTGSLTASGGNPDLQPYQSDNLDVTAEWYYSPNSYLAGNVFLKSVTNFVITGTQKLTLSNVIDPYTGSAAVFTMTTTVNGPKANVYGMEIAWQHMFGDTGFGFQLNGTIVGTDKPYNPWDLTTSNFAVTGLADSANLVAFYDKDGFEIRLAANWRDSYLDHFGQNQNNSAFGTEPTFVNASWSLDGSTSFDLSDHMNMYLEAQNITNESFSTRGRFSEQVLDVVSLGRRFTVGLHYKL